MRADVIKKDNHTYEADIKTVTANGIEKKRTMYVRLVRGSKLGEGIQRQDGLFTEQLLDICREYLESVNQGDLKNKYATMAIGNIQQAMYWLEERQKDRQERGVAHTYKKWSKEFISGIYPKAVGPDQVRLDAIRTVFSDFNELRRLKEPSLVRLGQLLGVNTSERFLKKVNQKLVWEKLKV